ncbi:MAG: peptide ABC transporter substrate-binding protein [Planctomycetota bacterium]
MTRYLVVLFVMVLTAVVLATFSFEDELPPLPDDPQNRGTFYYSDTTGVGSLDPGRTSASIDFRVLKCLYQTLMVYAQGGETLEPGVAESYELSEDGKTYTFQLREDAKWSNGEPVTASDFFFAWRRAMLSETGSDYASLFYLIKGGQAFSYWRAGLLDYSSLELVIEDQEERTAFKAKYPELQAQSNLSADEKWDLTVKHFDQTVGVKVLGEWTLEVTITNPASYFIELCAFPSFSPLPQRVIEQNMLAMLDDGTVRMDPKYWDDPERLVTNGPYMLERNENKRRLVMDQNPHYWDRDRMGNLRIVNVVVPDESLAFALFEDGQLDWIASISSSELRAKIYSIDYYEITKSNPSSDDGTGVINSIDHYPYIHPSPRAGVYYYQFNCRPTLSNGLDNPMADVRVRQALGMCIDRKKIVESVTRNYEPLAYTFVPVGSIPTYNAPVEAGLRFNPAKARELLAEAGYKDGEGFPAITLLINASGTGGGGHEDIALVIKKVWEEELGLPDVGIEAPEFQVYIEQSKRGDFAIRRAGWYGDYRDPTTWLDMLRSKDSNNDAGYNNPEYDGLLKRAAVEADPERRMQILREAETLLLTEAPVVPIYYYKEAMVFDETQIDLRPNAWNNLRLDLVRKKRVD